jgi:hypothetical protein
MLVKYTSHAHDAHVARDTTFTIFPVKANAKTPLTAHGFKDASADPDQIAEWKQQFPGCNWGAPTGEANGFVVLDLDAKHPLSLGWWREQQDIHGGVNTREVATPSGGTHIYFQDPEGVALKSTASVIASGVDTRAEGGYVVIPPSVIDGNPYEVINDVPIAPLPDWLLAIWPRVGERRERTGDGRYCTGDVPHCTAEGSNLLTTPLPEKRRNVGLTSVAGYLWNHCPNVQELGAQLLEANERLCQPPLPDDEVLTIAGSVSRYPKEYRTTADTASWEMPSTEGVEPYYMEGSDGPRRRFPLHTDYGAIDKLRRRMEPTWLRNRILQGDHIGHDRALHCRELTGRKGTRCGVVQCDGDCIRSTCKQRLHPLCLGALARKPLRKKQELIELESNLTIFVTGLGSYDVSPDSLGPQGTVRDMIGQVYQWINHLAKLKDCPDSVKTSFSGVRADLHQGYLTLSLVLLGPASFGAAAYLRDYFQQATERDVDVDVIPCRNADTAIDTFGNLMSSMAIYDTEDECQELMEAFKHHRIAQARGRFMKHPVQDEETDVSREVSSGSTLETSGGSEAAKSTKSGGSKPSPCHVCGCETVSVGRISGDWVKEKRGEFSGKPYWRLRVPPAGGPGEGYEDLRRDVARAKEEQLLVY